MRGEIQMRASSGLHPALTVLLRKGGRGKWVWRRQLFGRGSGRAPLRLRLRPGTQGTRRRPTTAITISLRLEL